MNGITFLEQSPQVWELGKGIIHELAQLILPRLECA